MKKIFIVLLTLALVACGFVGCGSSNNNSGANNENTVQNPDEHLLDDFVFTLQDDGTYECKIKETSSAESLTVPTTYNGKTVTSFGGIVHTSAAEPKNIKNITISQEITKINGMNFASHNVSIYYTSDLLSWAQKDIVSIPIGTELYINNQRVAGQLILPEGITTLKKGPFSFLEDIVSVTLPSSLTSIEGDALYNGYHREVKEVINHSSLDIKAGYKNNGGIAKNAKYVHSGSKSKLEILDGFVIDEHTVINYIGESTELVFPVHNVGMYNIGSYAFSGRDDITSIAFSDSVLKIGSGAFARCDNLQSVTISKSVIEIGYNAFGECSALNNAVFKDTEGWYYEYEYTYTVWSYWVGNHFVPAHDETKIIETDISALDDEVGAAGKLKSGLDDETWLKKTGQ